MYMYSRSEVEREGGGEGEKGSEEGRDSGGGRRGGKWHD